MDLVAKIGVDTAENEPRFLAKNEFPNQTIQNIEKNVQKRENICVKVCILMYFVDLSESFQVSIYMYLLFTCKNRRAAEKGLSKLAKSYAKIRKKSQKNIGFRPPSPAYQTVGRWTPGVSPASTRPASRAQ